MAGDAPIALNATIAAEIAEVTWASMERTGISLSGAYQMDALSAALIGNA